VPIKPTYFVLDTNFLRFIRTNKGGTLWLDYCREARLPLSTNLLFPPTLLIEYAGATPKRTLPKIRKPVSGEDVAAWVQNCATECRKFYDNKQLSTMVAVTMKDLRKKCGDCRRSEPSRRTFRAARTRWKKHRSDFRENLLNALVFNAMTSFPHEDQERVDTYVQLLLWLLDLWEAGMPIPFFKLTHLTCERLRLIGSKMNKVTITGQGWPDPEKLGNLKPLDLGDSDFISYAVLGFPLGKGSLVPVEVFTADPRDITIERIKMCRDVLHALLELLTERGFGDRIKLRPAPGVVHFSNKDGFVAPIHVSAL
jgi:hypothetical protein